MEFPLFRIFLKYRYLWYVNCFTTQNTIYEDYSYHFHLLDGLCAFFIE